MADSSADSFVHLHVHTEYSMLDGAARVKDLFAEAARMEMPALAMTDHGNVFGAYDFWKQAKAAGVKPIIGMEAYVTPGTSRYERTRVRWADGGEDDVSGGGAFTHMTLLAENTAGHAQPVPALQPGQPRGLLLQAAHRPRAARDLRQGPDRHHRLPVRGDPDPAADRRLRRRQAGGRRAAGHLRPGELLPRADGPRARHRAPGPRRPDARWPPTSPCRSSRPTTCTTPTPPTPRRTRCCSASSPARRWPTPTGSSSTPTTSTSSRRRRCARCGASCPRPATTRC